MPIGGRGGGRLLRKLPPNVLRDDLLAAGTFGLVDALRKSADRGPAFDWYARIRIRGAVVDELRAQDWLTRRARTRVARAQAEGAGGSAAAVRVDGPPHRPTPQSHYRGGVGTYDVFGSRRKHRGCSGAPSA